MAATMTFGGAPKCIKCVKAVYFTEQVPGPGGLYHKTCLTCTECSKRLDSTSLTEKDGAPYCKSCYGKLFGPRGFGYGSAMASTDGAVRSSPTLASPGSVSSSRDSLANAAAPSTKAPSPTVTKTSVQGDGCPTCTKPVYFAEQILGPGGLKYHKLCFKCSDCSKILDSSSVAEKDTVLFCRPCHGKRYGPKGFGYGVLNTERAS